MMAPSVPTAHCTDTGSHMFLRNGSGEKVVAKVGAVSVQAEVQHKSTNRLHTENVLKVVAGQAPGVSDATQARVVVNKKVLPGVLSPRPIFSTQFWDMMVRY